MRTRSLLTTRACAAVMTGVGAGTAFADTTSAPTSTAPTTEAPSAVPSTPTTTAPGDPTAVPSPSARPTSAPGVMPPPVPTTDSRNQVRGVPSGAPNTGVPSVKSSGHGEAEALGASLVLLGGSGTLVLRRRLKGRG